MNNSLASNIPQCAGWEDRSVLWGEEHQIKHKVAFVICFSKPDDSISNSQRKLKVPSCLPIWEKCDLDGTSLLCFLWKTFSTSWKPVSYISPWKGTLGYGGTVMFIKQYKVLILGNISNHLCVWVCFFFFFIFILKRKKYVFLFCGCIRNFVTYWAREQLPKSASCLSSHSLLSACNLKLKVMCMGSHSLPQHQAKSIQRAFARSLLQGIEKLY